MIAPYQPISNQSTDRSIFVCVGDISADRHTSRLVKKLKILAPEIKFWGLGGPDMEKLGVEIIANCQNFATLGIIEPIRLLPFFHQLRSSIIKRIAAEQPVCALLVDFGGFNIGLAQILRAKFPQLPIIYFISPQVWGSRPWRINVLKKCITKMLTIFPFEETIYRSKGIDACFVGHPLTLSVASQCQISKKQFCHNHSLDEDKPLIGIFPGSRKREIIDLMPIVLMAVDWLIAERPNLQFAISRANVVIAQTLDSIIARSPFKHLVGNGITLLPIGDNFDLMASADILWTKSGTTTLEASLFAKPMLIFYRGNWLSYLLVLAFKQVNHFGWPNLLAGKQIVPELIQLDCRAEQLVRYTSNWLDVPAARQLISQNLKQISHQIGQVGDYAETAAAEILKTIA